MAESDDNHWGGAAGLGLQVAVGVGLGVVVGQWLDKHYGLSGKGTTIGAVVGFVAGMYLLIKGAMKLNK